MGRRTKIVATLGPATDPPGLLEDALAAGVDVVRMNLSHGSLDEHVERIERVRRAETTLGRPIAVLADLPGPKIRAGQFPHGGVDLAPGSLVRLVPGDGVSDASTITIPYGTLLDDVEDGSRVQLGDGMISMRVIDVDHDQAVASIETGGHANGQPGVHLASERLRLATPTEEDLQLAADIIEHGVEYVAVSFVRRGSDVERVREVTKRSTSLIAKIETRAAVDHLAEVVEASDAVMVARGDLGIDCPVEDVPHMQKRIIRYCVEAGVPVITATQMLESMIHAPSPTRAEVSDVANAVFDGTDAVMLSGETAIGRDPVGVVATMSSIATRAEQEASYRGWAQRLARVQRDAPEDDPHLSSIDPITAAITHAASQAAEDADASAILCCTRSGRTVRAMARYRPVAGLVGLSPDLRTVRSMCLNWGVDPVQVDQYDSTDEMVWFAVERALERGEVDHGDVVLVLAGAPVERPDGDDEGPSGIPDVATDVLRLVRVA